MGRKFTACQIIKIVFQAQTEIIADEFMEYIVDEFAGVDWELYRELTPDTYCLEAGESAEGWYDPGCMYTKNGDGWPAEYDVEFEVVESDLAETCYRFEDEHEGIQIKQVSCEEDY